jgi:hypothetical protein
MPALSGDVLWLAAFLFYFVDSLQPATSNTIVIERRWRRFDVMLLRYPTGLFKKRYFIPNPIAPFSIAMLSRWTDSASTVPAQADRAFLLQKNLDVLWPLRTLSGAAFLVMFAIIPGITFATNLTIGLIIGMPILYGINLAQAVILWRHRKLHGWTKWKAASNTANFLFCPPYGANVARTLAAHHQLGEDGLRIAMRFAPAATIRNVVGPLLSDFGESFDESDELPLISYRKAVMRNDL